ncbi:hypothetical protein CARUB_v10011145mg [Capsella rubella]|uniref:Uncharacterized protein n=1 Tax=Capsella rubella TaxID=81985 RepID=R0GSQ3_9BRAS|nr:hypothetical protein CARUB_v10011145mg [Capsella rubella]
MEGKGVVAMLVAMMMVMGNLLPQAEAQSTSFRQCLTPCLLHCGNDLSFQHIITCPYDCFQTCLDPTTPSPPPSPSPKSDNN